MIEIKHLRLLQALASEGSLSGAARALGYSQPAVTQQLQKLEADLGTPLLTRSTKGVHLTNAGEVLVRHGASVLSTMSLARAEVEAVAGLRSGQVRVTSFASAAATLLPGAFAAVSQAHPGVSFTLVEALPGRSLEMLREGDCDLAVVYRYSSGSTLDEPEPAVFADEVSTDLVEENVYVALPRSHPASSKTRITLNDLRHDRWIAGCPSCRGNLVNSCEVAGFVPDIGFETDDYVALQRLVAAGLGVALVTDLMLAAARPDSDMLLRKLSPAPLRTVRVVSSQSLMRVPGVRQTIDALRTAARGLDLVTVV